MLNAYRLLSFIEKMKTPLLGRMVEYPQRYTPDILAPVPRSENRLQYGISATNLPFVGFDAWHAYEVSFLLTSGLPVVRLAKIVYSADSKYIIESKSLKLYLNSFNMEPMGNTIANACCEVQQRIATDLSAAVGCNVEVMLFAPDAEALTLDFSDYQVLEDTCLTDSLRISDYTETPSLMQAAASGGDIRVCSHLLRSNCKITHQPDWGSVFISMKADTLPTPESLLAYIVSARGENHFHEEICEMFFKRLSDRFSPAELMVACIYTRRGGIDICPVRATSGALLPPLLCSAAHLTQKLLRQ